MHSTPRTTVCILGQVKYELVLCIRSTSVVWIQAPIFTEIKNESKDTRIKLKMGHFKTA